MTTRIDKISFDYRGAARRSAHWLYMTLSLIFLATLVACEQKPSIPKPTASNECTRTVKADVVALDQLYYYNRLGAFNPAGLVYALRRDVVHSLDKNDSEELKKDGDELEKLNGQPIGTGGDPGHVSLRSDKRPRPLVLRMNEGDCLEIKFTNLLSRNVDAQEEATDPETNQRMIIDTEDPVTRHVSMHVNGLEYVQSIRDDGSNVGNNESSLVAPGETVTYKWHAKAGTEGGHLFYSMGAAAGGEGDGGQLGLGLFGSVNVAPKNARWYRSQVTAEELQLATKKDGQGNLIKTKPYGQPVIDYDARYQENDPDRPWIRKGDPILSMLNGENEIVYSDLNAVIDIDETGESKAYCDGMSEGNACGKPYREFTTIFHDEITAVQAFQELEDETSPYSSVRDGMGINYGAAGMGAMVLANRKSFELGPDGKRTDKRIGPAADCAECKLEEFFLSSWANGDPAMVVERDVNNKVTKALYPDDPSNVHHSYMGDPVRFRNMHAGPKETHVFHLHAHQWLQDKHDPNSVYLDSQTISPGAVFSYEVQYGGSGNRNMTVGDSIFHCHLYPHFAQGMWELWRSHDVFEDGTKERNLYDGEIAGGTPNPAIVPLPRTPLPPMPTKDFKGYPFFIAGEQGHRPPQPPLDLDEADYAQPSVPTLRRHIIESGSSVKISPKAVEEMIKLAADTNCESANNKGDLYTKGRQNSACIAGRVRAEAQPDVLGLARELDTANIKVLASDGESSEKRAIAFHAGIAGTSGERADPDKTTYNWPAKGYPTCKLTNNGKSEPVCDAPSKRPDDDSLKQSKERVLFHVNGQDAKPGAPYADPCPADPNGNNRLGTYLGADGKPNAVKMREYSAAYVQFDMTVNKAGWHDPQARIAVLEQDIPGTLDGSRPAEPLFFRARSGECITFKATNLIPSNLNLDDFQVFSPTDVIGQHIHLVKFDVTSSDGSGNGWNYEDGTLAADEIRERIIANNKYQIETGGSRILIPKTHRLFRTGEMSKKPENRVRGECPLPPTDKTDAAAWEAWSDKVSKENPWCGAQTSIQRWWADPLLNKKPGEPDANDRTIRTVFTHDHFGPSSHQHHGLYAALVVEPSNSKWTYPEQGEPMGGVGVDGNPKQIVDRNGVSRTDGGPTSYAANVITRKYGKRDACVANKNEPAETKCLDEDNPENVDADRTAREFGLAFADYALIYTSNNQPVNAVNRLDGDLPNPSIHPRRPTPEGISTKDPGTQLLNYRNEPIPLRVAAESSVSSNTFTQKQYNQEECRTALLKASSTLNGILPNPSAKACAGDMAYVFNSDVHGDPATPLLRAYDGDRVQLRLIQGAQEENHIFNMHGVKWLSEPDSKNSGWMNAQPIGISEHFEFNVELYDPGDNRGNTDYLYSSTATDNLWDGQWGILRAYDSSKPKANLKKLPVVQDRPASVSDIPDTCPSEAGHPIEYHISAWHAREVLKDLSGGALVYNERFGIKDPNAILFLEDPKDKITHKRIVARDDQLKELNRQFVSRERLPEPLILRMAAGQCTTVSLTNRLLTQDGSNSKMPDADLNNANVWSFNTLPPTIDSLNFNQLKSSSRVSLHPQLVDLKTYNSDGAAVGTNIDTTVAPGQSYAYTWYAGKVKFDKAGKPIPIPIEFGAVALRDMADVIKHSSHGAIGALVIEPVDAKFKRPSDTEKAKQFDNNHCGPDLNSNASATICDKNFKPLFREFVVLYQDDLSLQQDGQPMANLRSADDAEDTGQKAFNYRTEPLWARIGTVPSATPEMTNAYDFSNAFSSKVPHAGCSNPPCDPETPIFSAKAGMEVRFRVVHPAGHPRNHSFTVFGHDWLTNPWTEDSTVMGYNKDNGNRVGSAYGIGPMRHVNIMIDKAGGDFSIPGDYLYRTQEGFNLGGGLWGIFCVYNDKNPKRCESRGLVPTVVSTK
jgi:manganese oxidase